jgi:alpha-L-arabinofuranosidase
VLAALTLALPVPHPGYAFAPSEPAIITVHADRMLATVNPLLFGHNYGPWMNITDPYIALYRDIKVTLLRFPAGNWGDENDLFPNNLDDLATLARALGAEIVVQARLFRGTPEKAAEVVRYCNVEHDYDFRYWEIGNEPDLYKNRRHRRGDPEFTVEWYNARFREFAKAMKAVDPTIQIAGPVVTGGWRQWMPAFIAANGDIVDVLSWHWYAPGDELSGAAALATP